VRDRKYYESNIEKKKGYDSIYRKQNKDRISKYLKVYYSKNKEKIFETNKLWRKNNPNTHKEISRRAVQKRLAIKRKLPATFTKEQWTDCKKHFSDSCAYCGSKTKLEQDHFIPLSKGGEYTKDNIVPSCKKCNVTKSNHDFEFWYYEQPFYSKSREIKIFNYLGYKNNNQQLTLL